MIYVECKPDAILVRAVTKLPRREVIHEIKGKYEIAKRLSSAEHSDAVVDEDPQSSQPAYLSALEPVQDLPEVGLRLLLDTRRSNRVVILRPRLEEWIIYAATEEGLELDRRGLPNRGPALHSVINFDLRKFERVVQDLRNSERLRALSAMLTATSRGH